MDDILRFVFNLVVKSVAAVIIWCLQIIFPRLENSNRNQTKISLFMLSIVTWALYWFVGGGGTEAYLFAAVASTIGFLYSLFWSWRIGKRVSAVIQDPLKDRFYRGTKAAWSSGQIPSSLSGLEGDSKASYTDFVLSRMPDDGTGLYTFFREFPPKANEVLIATDSSTKRDWFVLTNERLIQKDGRNKSFKEVVLRDVDTITADPGKSLGFKMKSGEIVDFEGIGSYPSESFIKGVIEYGSDSQ